MRAAVACRRCPWPRNGASSPAFHGRSRNFTQRRARRGMRTRPRPRLIAHAMDYLCKVVSRARPQCRLRGRRYVGPVNKPGAVPHLEAVELLTHVLGKNAPGFLDQCIIRPGFQERHALDPAAAHEVAAHFPSQTAHCCAWCRYPGGMPPPGTLVPRPLRNPRPRCATGGLTTARHHTYATPSTWPTHHANRAGGSYAPHRDCIPPAPTSPRFGSRAATMRPPPPAVRRHGIVPRCS